MPEDCLKLETDFNPEAQTEAEKLLADTIFSLQTMNRFAEVEHTTHKVEFDNRDTVDWDGNVPPDMTDDFLFLL